MQEYVSEMTGQLCTCPDGKVRTIVGGHYTGCLWFTFADRTTFKANDCVKYHR